jgi:hypothetical protein
MAPQPALCGELALLREEVAAWGTFYCAVRCFPGIYARLPDAQRAPRTELEDLQLAASGAKNKNETGACTRLARFRGAHPPVPVQEQKGLELSLRR